MMVTRVHTHMSMYKCMCNYMCIYLHVGTCTHMGVCVCMNEKHPHKFMYLISGFPMVVCLGVSGICRQWSLTGGRTPPRARLEHLWPLTTAS